MCGVVLVLAERVRSRQELMEAQKMHPSLSHQPLTVTLLSQGQSRVLAQTTATKPSLDNSPDPCNSLFAIRIADRTGFVRVGNVVDPRPPAETDVQIHD